MPKIQPTPLKYRQLLKRLKDFGVIEDLSRGKGSERILILESRLGSKYKGPQYPVKCHGDGTEINKGAIKAILRHFNIKPEDFW